ncbi:MAG: A/G-specific adenine glycosylase [Planctomycetes bacterium]|nr:A/G-specific adenine glycosylase [Planctomycetota bacterium]
MARAGSPSRSVGRRATKKQSAKTAVKGEAVRDGRIVRSLAAWFAKNGRDLPWRTEPRQAYPSLVSELMLQQTQVSRVLEKFGPFMARFASVRALAEAHENEVMAAWSGLGYYRRARLLHACAKAIVRAHDGAIPVSIELLEELPGIGRYTAGAIASIVFGERAAIVDGNVCRVLQRLEAREGHAGDKNVMEWAWNRAEQLVTLTSRGKQVARFNEGLMELGATVCTPDGPKCGECPLANDCGALASGSTATIPAAKPRAQRQAVHHDVIVVYRKTRGGEYEFLLEQRPATGLWAGLWQPPSLAGQPATPEFASLASKLGLPQTLSAQSQLPSETIFQTTHRTVHFRAWAAEAAASFRAGRRRWHRGTLLHAVGISNAHLALLRNTPA